MIKRINKSCNVLGLALLLWASSLHAAGTPLFSYNEWIELAQNYTCDQDLIVLADGSKLCGKVERLPAIDFIFGRVTFSVDELALATLLEQRGQLYVQYITQSGHCYVGPVAKGSFRIAIQNREKEILPRQIQYLIFTKRQTPRVHARFSTLILKNGQQFPIAHPSRAITLSDDIGERKLDPRDIVAVSFEGPLSGTLKQGDLSAIFGSVFVKDRLLLLQTPKSRDTIPISWELVSEIQTGQNGFKTDLARAAGHLVGASVYIPPLVATVDVEVAPRPTTMYASLGNEAGNALDGASAFVSVEPPALFDASEEPSWAMDIVFEEQPTEWQEIVAAALPKVDEPPALFDSSEEPSWAMDIVFEEQPTDWQEIVAAALPKVDEPPALFDSSEEPSWAMDIVFEEQPTEWREIVAAALPKMAEDAIAELKLTRTAVARNLVAPLLSQADEAEEHALLDSLFN